MNYIVFLFIILDSLLFSILGKSESIKFSFIVVNSVFLAIVLSLFSRYVEKKEKEKKKIEEENQEKLNYYKRFRRGK